MSHTGHILVGDNDNGLTFCRGILALSGRAVDAAAEAGLGNIDDTWKKARQQRDGDHYHVTLMTKADVQRCADELRSGGDNAVLTDMLKAVDCHLEPPESTDSAAIAQCIATLVAKSPGGLSSWIDIGEGRAKDGTDEAAFRVLLWPAATAVRQAFNLPPQDFHISLGFCKHDVHAKSKGISSLCSGAPIPSSLPGLLDQASSLLEARQGIDINAEGIESLAEGALLGASAIDDKEQEAAALRILCTLHGKMKQPDKVLTVAERLLEIDPRDEVGTKSRAFAMFMMGDYEKAWPALAQVREQLHARQDADSEVEEAKIRQAEAVCQRKLKR